MMLKKTTLWLLSVMLQAVAAEKKRKLPMTARSSSFTHP